jgi:phosphoribosylaminoimidazole carboxylase (NCAIR synthetase)
MVLALVAVAAPIAMRCAAAVAVLDAETENDAALTTLADTVSVLTPDAENAPMQTRFAENAAVLVAAKVTAPRLTP